MAQHVKDKFPIGVSATMCYKNDRARFHLKTKDSLVCFDIKTNHMNMDNSDHHNRCEKANMLLLANDGKLKVQEAM